MSDERARDLDRDLNTEIVRGLNDPRLLAAMEENAAYALADIAASFDGSERSHGPDMTRYLSGIPIPFLNGVFSLHLPMDGLDAAIVEALAPFKERSLPMMWVIGPGSRPNDLGAHLETHGLTKGDETPCMAVEIAAIPPLTPLPAVTFVEVTSEPLVDQFAHTAAAGFGFGAEAVPIFQQIATRACLSPQSQQPQLVQQHQWVYHLGSLDGQPVATCTTFLHGGVAGLYTICTVPEARGRGIGGAITQLALHHAGALGYRVSVLQATPMGLPVYRRLGYVTCAVFQEYTWTPPLAAESAGS